jgi:hypothetical protein
MAEQLMELACCSLEEATELLKKTNDIVEALTLHMSVPVGRDAPKPKKLSMIQQFFKETREEMLTLTESISKGFVPAPTLSYQSEPSESVAMQGLPEETAQQSNCEQECHPLALESEVRIPETVYPLQSECSSGLQSSDQTLQGSRQEQTQRTPSPKKVSWGRDAEIVASVP